MASPEEMAQTMIRNLPEKTGKPLDEWLSLVKSSGLNKHGEIVKWLKADHGMTHGFANLVAAKSLETGADAAAGDPVDALYGGAKSGLRPIHDALMTLVTGLGKDVEIAPKKTYVSVRRAKQFAIIQPSTKTRVDLGLNLKGVPADGRLEESGSFNAMVSHRVRLEQVQDINDDVADWIRQAYQGAAK